MAWGGSGFSRLGDWGFTGPAVWLCGSEVCSGESVPYIHIIIHIYIMLYVCVYIYICMAVTTGPLKSLAINAHAGAELCKSRQLHCHIQYT